MFDYKWIIQINYALKEEFKNDNPFYLGSLTEYYLL